MESLESDRPIQVFSTSKHGKSPCLRLTQQNQQSGTSSVRKNTDEALPVSKPNNQFERGSRNVKFANLLTISKSKNSMTSGNSLKSMPS